MATATLLLFLLFILLVSALLLYRQLDYLPSTVLHCKSSFFMCEFCSLPTIGDRDANHIDFAGFFSPAAIEAAVQQANANRQAQDDEDETNDDDDDGT